MSRYTNGPAHLGTLSLESQDAATRQQALESPPQIYPTSMVEKDSGLNTRQTVKLDEAFLDAVNWPTVMQSSSSAWAKADDLQELKISIKTLSSDSSPLLSSREIPSASDRPHREEMAQDTESRPENPLLCDSCQIWDNVDSYAEWWPYPEGFNILENVPESVQCIICKAAMTAIAARVSQMNIPQTSRVLFRNNGPFFLDHDTGEPSKSISHRIDTSDPSESIVRLLMCLVVKVESVTSSVAATDQDKQSEFEMTPQFCLRYGRNGSQSYLKSVEPWEVPLFDVSLLKQWLQGCAKIHGAECRRNIQTKLGQ